MEGPRRRAGAVIGAGRACALDWWRGEGKGVGGRRAPRIRPLRVCVCVRACMHVCVCVCVCVCV